MKKIFLHYKIHWFVLFYLLQVSCSKDPIIERIDPNLLSSVLSDNQGLAMFETAVMRSNRVNELKQKEPYTLLAPSNQAFMNLGFASTKALLQADLTYLSRIADNHILLGIHDFLALPLGNNHVLEIAENRKYYISRQLQGKDTVTAVNGARISPKYMQASNGLLYVLNQIIEPNNYINVSEALAGSTDVALFNFAVQKAGLLEQLQNSEQQYTVFAPDNAAMQQWGYGSLESLETADKNKLLDMVNSHITKGLHFVVDYELESYPDNLPLSIPALKNNTTIKAQYMSYYDWNVSQSELFRIVLKGEGFGDFDEALIIRKDVLTGNGVVHVINKALVNP